MASNKYPSLGVIFAIILGTAPVIAYAEETSMAQSLNKSFKLSEVRQNEERHGESKHGSDSHLDGKCKGGKHGKDSGEGDCGSHRHKQKKGENGNVKGALSGEQVYRETCFSCHATGVQNAPRFGDKVAWAPLLEERQETVSAHGWVGERGMPPRGGRPDLSLPGRGNAGANKRRRKGTH